MMDLYGVLLIDKHVAQHRVLAIIKTLNPAQQVPMAFLEPLHTAKAPRFNPLARHLQNIMDASKSYEVLVSLLTIHSLLIKEPVDEDNNLALEVSELLTYLDIKERNKQLCKKYSDLSVKPL